MPQSVDRQFWDILGLCSMFGDAESSPRGDREDLASPGTTTEHTVVPPRRATAEIATQTGEDDVGAQKQTATEIATQTGEDGPGIENNAAGAARTAEPGAVRDVAPTTTSDSRATHGSQTISGQPATGPAQGSVTQAGGTITDATFRSGNRTQELASLASMGLVSGMSRQVQGPPDLSTAQDQAAPGTLSPQQQSMPATPNGPTLVAPGSRTTDGQTTTTDGRAAPGSQTISGQAATGPTPGSAAQAGGVGTDANFRTGDKNQELEALRGMGIVSRTLGRASRDLSTAQDQASPGTLSPQQQSMPATPNGPTLVAPGSRTTAGQTTTTDGRAAPGSQAIDGQTATGPTPGSAAQTADQATVASGSEAQAGGLGTDATFRSGDRTQELEALRGMGIVSRTLNQIQDRQDLSTAQDQASPGTLSPQQQSMPATPNGPTLVAPGSRTTAGQTTTTDGRAAPGSQAIDGQTATGPTPGSAAQTADQATVASGSAAQAGGVGTDANFRTGDKNQELEALRGMGIVSRTLGRAPRDLSTAQDQAAPGTLSPQQQSMPATPNGPTLVAPGSRTTAGQTTTTDGRAAPGSQAIDGQTATGPTPGSAAQTASPAAPGAQTMGGQAATGPTPGSAAQAGGVGTDANFRTGDKNQELEALRGMGIVSRTLGRAPRDLSTAQDPASPGTLSPQQQSMPATPNGPTLVAPGSRTTDGQTTTTDSRAAPGSQTISGQTATGPAQGSAAQTADQATVASGSAAQAGGVGTDADFRTGDKNQELEALRRMRVVRRTLNQMQDRQDLSTSVGQGDPEALSPQQQSMPATPDGQILETQGSRMSGRGADSGGPGGGTAMSGAGQSSLDGNNIGANGANATALGNDGMESASATPDGSTLETQDSQMSGQGIDSGGPGGGIGGVDPSSLNGNNIGVNGTYSTDSPGGHEGGATVDGVEQSSLDGNGMGANGAGAIAVGSDGMEDGHSEPNEVSGLSADINKELMAEEADNFIGHVAQSAVAEESLGQDGGTGRASMMHGPGFMDDRAFVEKICNEGALTLSYQGRNIGGVSLSDTDARALRSGYIKGVDREHIHSRVVEGKRVVTCDPIPGAEIVCDVRAIAAASERESARIEMPGAVAECSIVNGVTKYEMIEGACEISVTRGGQTIDIDLDAENGPKIINMPPGFNAARYGTSAEFTYTDKEGNKQVTTLGAMIEERQRAQYASMAPAPGPFIDPRQSHIEQGGQIYLANNGMHPLPDVPVDMPGAHELQGNAAAVSSNQQETTTAANHDIQETSRGDAPEHITDAKGNDPAVAARGTESRASESGAVSNNAATQSVNANEAPIQSMQAETYSGKRAATTSTGRDTQEQPDTVAPVHQAANAAAAQVNEVSTVPLADMSGDRSVVSSDIPAQTLSTHELQGNAAEVSTNQPESPIAANHDIQETSRVNAGDAPEHVTDAKGNEPAMVARGTESRATEGGEVSNDAATQSVNANDAPIQSTNAEIYRGGGHEARIITDRGTADAQTPITAEVGGPIDIGTADSVESPQILDLVEAEHNAEAQVQVDEFSTDDRGSSVAKEAWSSSPAQDNTQEQEYEEAAQEEVQDVGRIQAEEYEDVDEEAQPDTPPEPKDIMPGNTPAEPSNDNKLVDIAENSHDSANLDSMALEDIEDSGLSRPASTVDSSIVSNAFADVADDPAIGSALDSPAGAALSTIEGTKIVKNIEKAGMEKHLGAGRDMGMDTARAQRSFSAGR